MEFNLTEELEKYKNQSPEIEQSTQSQLYIKCIKLLH